MRVNTNKKRAVRFLLFPILANGLGDGQNVALVEGPLEGRSAMAGSAKGHPLRRNRWIGQISVISGNQPRHINQDFSRGGFSRQWANIHTVIQFPEANSDANLTEKSFRIKNRFYRAGALRCNGGCCPRSLVSLRRAGLQPFQGPQNVLLHTRIVKVPQMSALCEDRQLFRRQRGPEPMDIVRRRPENRCD